MEPRSQTSPAPLRGLGDKDPTDPDGRGGVRWLAPLGERVCPPFEEGRWVGCPPVGLGVKREGFETLQEVGSLFGYLTAGINYCYCVRVRQLFHYSQLLLLPMGVPPMLAPACSTQRLSQDCEVWRVLTTTQVGNVTQGHGFQITKCYHQWCAAFSGSLPVVSGIHRRCRWSGCFSHQGPTVGPRQCFAVSVRPTKVLQRA